MKRILPIAMAAGALALAGCATTGDSDGGDAGEIKGSCKVDAAKPFIGQKATAEVGAQMLRASRAKQLRWAPPNSALTMDFNTDRLTVFYNESMTIERVDCV